MSFVDKFNKNIKSGNTTTNASMRQTHIDTQQVSRSQSETSAFLKQTYQLFAGSLLSGTIGAYIGLDIASTIQSWFWGLVILELALLFGIYKTKRNPPVALFMLFAFTFISGLTITPLLTNILAMPSGAGIVANAFMLTTVIFGGLSIYAMSTKTSYMEMGKGLFIALIIVIIGSVINIFLGSPILQIIIASVGAMLFSAFILYDTQNIINGNYETPIEGAVALYLDFLNLFISLLQILGILGSDD